MENVHPELLQAQKNAYLPSGLIGSNFQKEREGKEYGAYEFKLNQKQIKFRVGKTTPKKKGHFVALWKRKEDGPILPLGLEDPFDLIVISVSTLQHFGQFVFPKVVLCEQGIVSKDGRGGKLAFRVYPSWVVVDNKQASKTQAWQLNYFFEIFPEALLDIKRIQTLFLN